jgi:hypothetical protein
MPCPAVSIWDVNWDGGQGGTSSPLQTPAWVRGNRSFNMKCMCEPEYYETNTTTRKLFKNLFGFEDYAQAEHFMLSTWPEIDNIDEPGGCAMGTQRKEEVLTPMEQFLASLWCMKHSEDRLLVSNFLGVSYSSMGNVVNYWVPKCGAAGRSLVSKARQIALASMDCHLFVCRFSCQTRTTSAEQCHSHFGIAVWGMWA